MFNPIASLNENVQQFLSIAEAQKILADLNEILHKTGFSPKPSNPCFLLALLASFGTVAPFVMLITMSDFSNSRNAGLQIQMSVALFVVSMMLPFVCFFVLLIYMKSSRRKQLTNYIADWNRWHLELE